MFENTQHSNETRTWQNLEKVEKFTRSCLMFTTAAVWMSLGSFQLSSTASYTPIPNLGSDDENELISEKRSYPDVRPRIQKSEINVDLAALENVDPTRLTFFLDQTRPIDYVLVYGVQREEREGGDQQAVAKRDHFFQEAESLGLETEKTQAIQLSGNVTFFVKVHIPWDTIKDWAEKLHARVPLQESPIELLNWSEKVFNFLRISKLNFMKSPVPTLPKHYYSAQFRADRLEQYLFKGEPEKLFTRTQRSYIVREMLETIVYGDAHMGEVGLQRLLNENVFKAAFPLHDGTLNEEFKNPTLSTEINQRQILRDYWASFKCCFRYQPIGHISSYFGEQVALYFAWLGMYTAWLIPLSVIGCVLFSYGVFNVQTDPIVEEICETGDQFRMCPVCDGCPYWFIKQACGAKKLGYIFDNTWTCINAFILSLWAIFFVDSWKHKNAQLTHYFDCEECEQEDEHPRAEFSRQAPKMHRNVVTGLLEPYFPPQALMIRRVVGSIASISFLVIVFVVTFTVILIRTSLDAVLTRKFGMANLHRNLGPLVASVFNVVVILVLNEFYMIMATKLTNWEMHATQREHDDSLAWKAYWFQFVNVFSSMFYIAFVKGKFIGYPPGHYNKLANMMLESCDIGGCFWELGVQVIITVVLKQLLKNVVEIGYPLIKKRFQNRGLKLEPTTELNALFLDQQYKLLHYEGLTEEYLEMTIQFGTIVLFGAAFPLAPLLCFINNILEIRLDSQKLVVSSRRPLARRAQSIGIWLNVLQWVTVLSVWVNAFLIAFTSEALTQALYRFYHGSTRGYTNFTLSYAFSSEEASGEPCRYEDFRDRVGRHNKFHYQLAVLRLSFVLVYVCLVYLLSILVKSWIPDTPKNVLDARKRRRFLANQALQSTPAAAKEAYSRVRTSTQINPLAVSRPKSRKYHRR